MSSQGTERQGASWLPPWHPLSSVQLWCGAGEKQEQELGIVYSYQRDFSSKRSPSLDEFLHPSGHPHTYSLVKWNGSTVTIEDVPGSVTGEVEPLVP